jgi:hypothetical protein
VSPTKRGRPQKFGRPSQVVALTLPDDVVRGLRKVDPDVGWAIVTLFEKSPSRSSGEPKAQPDVELVTIADRRSIIVVNRSVINHLQGVSLVPLHGDRAFLALDAGRGMADLELAVIDGLDEPVLEARERKALLMLRAQLRSWRHDPSLRFHMRSIIVVERRSKRARPRT